MYVIVLNNDYNYINRVRARRAIALIEKGKVTVEKWSDKFIRTINRKYKIPLVVRLIKWVRTIYRRSVQWKAKNVHYRDNFMCRYCEREGLSGKELTIDHVKPLSRGGKSIFENTVTCCSKCNNKKGDRLPSEAGMFFKPKHFKPYQPTIMEFIIKSQREQGVLDVLETLMT